MKTILTTIFISNAAIFFVLAWISTDFDTAFNKFEEIVGLFWD